MTQSQRTIVSTLEQLEPLFFLTSSNLPGHLAENTDEGRMYKTEKTGEMYEVDEVYKMVSSQGLGAADLQPLWQVRVALEHLLVMYSDAHQSVTVLGEQQARLSETGT